MNITIVEDDKNMAINMWEKLRKNGFSYKIFNSYREFRSNNYYNSDLFIIDLNLWDGNWMDIIKYIKQKKQSLSPIIISSGISDIWIKVKWLNNWADDYLVKPFAPNELVARVKALIRRSYKVSYTKNILYKSYSFCSENRVLSNNWKNIRLSLTELSLTELLMLNIWKTITKEKIINSVWWEYDFTSVSDNTINVTISRLRKKLWKKFEIKTLASIWYVLIK